MRGGARPRPAVACTWRSPAPGGCLRPAVACAWRSPAPGSRLRLTVTCTHPPGTPWLDRRRRGHAGIRGGSSRTAPERGFLETLQQRGHFLSTPLAISRAPANRLSHRSAVFEAEATGHATCGQSRAVDPLGSSPARGSSRSFRPPAPGRSRSDAASDRRARVWRRVLLVSRRRGSAADVFTAGDGQRRRRSRGGGKACGAGVFTVERRDDLPALPRFGEGGRSERQRFPPAQRLRASLRARAIAPHAGAR